MALTLTGDIDAQTRYLTVTGTVPNSIEGGYRFRLGDEALELQGFVMPQHTVTVDRNRWYVRRAQDGSVGATHTTGTEVKGANDAFVSATSGTTPPNPFAGGSGGSQTLAQTLALGNDANQLRITNAADGVDPSDVATVGQLEGGGGGSPRVYKFPFAFDDFPVTPSTPARFSVVVNVGSGVFGLTYNGGNDGPTDVPDLPFDITAGALQQALASGSYPGSPDADYFTVTGAGTGGNPFIVTFVGTYGGAAGSLTSDDANATVTEVTPFTEGVADPIEVMTPTIGDLLIDAWIEVDTEWDGSGAGADIGMFSAGDDAGYRVVASAATAWDLSTPDESTTLSGGGGSLLSGGLLGSDSEFQTALASFGAAALPKRLAPGKFLTDDPLELCVTTTGVPSAPAPTSTQGSAVLYLVIATPVSL